MEVSAESLKVLVSQLLDSKTSRKFDSIIDIGSFLWEVVDKINETAKDSSLDLQQKEDLLVKISENVVNFMEEKGVITVELAERFRSLIKTADVFLDVILGLYSFATLNKVVANPTVENCFKTMFSVISCFSKKAANVVENKPEPVKVNPKVEEITTPNAIILTSSTVSNLGIAETVKLDETPLSNA